MDQQRPAVASGDPSDDGIADAAAQREIAQLREALAAAKARERVLLHELQHRVRNMLSVIRSVYRRTRESGASSDEFADHFQGRLDAIARYQSQVDDVTSPGVELEDMLRDELLAAHCLDGPNCAIEGPPVRLRQRSAELIALAIHELATNSIKFGALGRDGRLAVRWSLAEQGEGILLDFRWTETGISLVSATPPSPGFGQQLIEEALPYQLGATTSFDLRPGGVDCRIQLPLPRSAASDTGEEDACEDVG